MAKTNPKVTARKKRAKRVRTKVFGTAARPRLCVYKSNRHIYVQIIDDEQRRTLAAMSTEEWLIFYRSQLVLRRQRHISQMFVDGLVGKNFARALSFYLDQADRYLQDMAEMGRTRERMLQKEGRSPTA